MRAQPAVVPHFEVKRAAALIPCDGCGKTRPGSSLSEEALHVWKSFSNDDIFYKSCIGESWKRQTANAIFCNGQCQKDMPEYHVMETSLVQWPAGDITEAKCARCWALDEDLPKDNAYACHKCKKTKHISKFSPLSIKEWYGDNKHHPRWKCFDCQYPACTQCDKRPLHAIPHNALVDGVYYCADCKYQACHICKVNKRQSTGPDKRFKIYTCPSCLEKGSEAKCLKCEVPFVKKNANHRFC